MNRDESADIAKGIGILLVVGGHCDFAVPDIHPYAFHMPLFYFLSGFFLNRHVGCGFSASAFLLRKGRQLLVPFFLYNLLLGLMTYVLQAFGLIGHARQSGQCSR